MAVRGGNPINNSYEELFLRLLLSLLLIFDGRATATTSSSLLQVLQNNVTVAASSSERNAGLVSEWEGSTEHNTSARSVSHSRCDATFFDRDFFFTSPGYPDFYEHNLECVITIKRGQDVCRLQLVFQSFDVEQSSSHGCSADYVEIDGQRICGALPDNQDRVFSFTDSEIRIRFHTNAYGSGRGFSVRGRQLLCGGELTDAIRGGRPQVAFRPPPPPPLPTVSGRPCGQSYDDDTFEISSPNFPSPYEHDLNCVYTTRKCRTDVCSLQITFITVDLETSNECANDFLQFGERRYCNVPQPNPQTFDFPGQTFDIRFRSGSSLSRSGFRLRIQQRPCNGPTSVSPLPSYRPTQPPFPVDPVTGSCNLMLEEEGRGYDGVIFGVGQSERRPLQSLPRYVLRSPGFPRLPYPANQKCVYVMPKATVTVCALDVVVQEFEMASGPECDQDFFAVDGQRMCGTLPTGSTRSFNFPDRQIVLRFVTDSYRSDRGFSLILQQRDCLVPPFPNPDPFFPGSSTPFPTLPPRPYPTHPPSPTPRPFPLPTPKPFPPINCDQVFDTRAFVVTSPTFVPVNTLCTYTIRKWRHLPICSLQVEFATFDFGATNLFCTNGYLEIDGQRLCGPNTEGSIRTFLFVGDIMVIRFWSGLNAKPTFRLNALQRQCQEPDRPTPFPPSPSPLPPWTYGCGGFTVATNVISAGAERVTSQLTFELRSPGYPVAPYPPDLDCSYVVVKSSGRVCQLEIRVVDFQLEHSGQCQDDYLEINGIRLCGLYQPGTIKVFDFREREMVVRFRSNNVISGRGFLLHGRQIECWPGPSPSPGPPPYVPIVPPYNPYNGCNRTYQTDDVSLQSGFSSLAPGGVRCQYVICKSRIDVCYLDVEFKYFCLSEQRQSCDDGDYLDIGGRRHCGRIPAGSVRRYDFRSETIVLDFSSGHGLAEGLGFVIQVRQIPCGRYATEESQYFPVTPPTTPTPWPRPPLPVERCDVVYAQNQFQWESPNHPANYPDNADCTLTIRRNNPSICALHVRFLDFDIENSDNCIKDFLVVFGQRLCGSRLANTEQSFSFSEDFTTFHFHSDRFENGQGFRLSIEQKQCLDGPVFRNSGALRDTFEMESDETGSDNSTRVTIESNDTAESVTSSPNTRLVINADAENVTIRETAEQTDGPIMTTIGAKINP